MKDQKYIILFLSWVIFMCGIIIGSVAHDKLFHPIEQSIEKARQ